MIRDIRRGGQNRHPACGNEWNCGAGQSPVTVRNFPQGSAADTRGGRMRSSPGGLIPEREARIPRYPGASGVAWGMVQDGEMKPPLRRRDFRGNTGKKRVPEQAASWSARQLFSRAGWENTAACLCRNASGTCRVPDRTHGGEGAVRLSRFPHLPFRARFRAACRKTGRILDGISNVHYLDIVNVFLFVMADCQPGGTHADTAGGY